MGEPRSKSEQNDQQISGKAEVADGEGPVIEHATLVGRVHCRTYVDPSRGDETTSMCRVLPGRNDACDMSCLIVGGAGVPIL